MHHSGPDYSSDAIFHNHNNAFPTKRLNAEVNKCVHSAGCGSSAWCLTVRELAGEFAAVFGTISVRLF